MANEVPEHLRLVRRAQRDLDSLPAQERARIVDDLIRLAHRTLPGDIKQITSLPGRPLQADAGRFRILHLWDGPTVWILAIFARSHQRDVFRGLRRKPHTL